MNRILTVYFLFGVSAAVARDRFSHPVTATLTFSREEITRTPGSRTGPGSGIAGQVNGVGAAIQNDREPGVVRELHTASGELVLQIAVVRDGSGQAVYKVRQRLVGWIVSTSTPPSLASALVAERSDLQTRIGNWTRAVTPEEWAILEKEGKVPVDIGDTYKALELLKGSPPKLEASLGFYQISRFALVGESKKALADLTEQIRKAQERLDEAVKHHQEELEKAKKATAARDDRKWKIAEKKRELEHARNMRDFDPRIQAKKKELAKTRDELLKLNGEMARSQFAERLARAKKHSGLPATATEEEVKKALGPQAGLSQEIQKRQDLETRVTALDAELEKLRESIDPGGRIAKRTRELAELEAAASPEAAVAKQEPVVRAAIAEVEARWKELGDLKVKEQEMKARGALVFERVTVTGSKGVVFQAKLQDLDQIFDELRAVEERLKSLEKRMVQSDAKRGPLKEEALAAAKAEMDARASWLTFLLRSSIYLSQAAVALGVEVYDVGAATAEGGTAGFVGEVLKKGGERLVAGIAYGNWGEEYREPTEDYDYVWPKLDKETLTSYGGMSVAKGLLGQVLEPAEEMTWEAYMKVSARIAAAGRKVTSLKAGVDLGKDFLAGAAKKAVGELIVDGLVKDRVKENLQMVFAKFFADQATMQYVNEARRAVAAAREYLLAIDEYWTDRLAYLGQLKERERIARRFAEKAFNDITTKQKFPEGDPLTIELFPAKPTTTPPPGSENRIVTPHTVSLKLGARSFGLATGPSYRFKGVATELNETCEGTVDLDGTIVE